MKRNKVLILACTQNHVNKILADINDSTVVAALEYSAQKELDKRQISYRIPEDYTTNETYMDLDKKALSFARAWHSFGAHVEELVTYKNINLGELVEWEFTYFIAGVMKYIEMINCILEREQPDKIIVVDDNPEVNSIVEAEDEHLAIKTAIVVGKQKNIPVSIIKAPHSVHPPSKSLKFKVFHLIIPIFIKTLNFIHRLKSNKKNTERNTILMAIGWNYIGSAVKELKKNDANEIIMFGKGYNISWDSIKENVIHKCLKDYRIKMADNRVKLKQKWNELDNNQEFRESMVYQSIATWSLVKERLEYLFLNRFPELIKDIEIFKYMRDKEKIDMIVVAYDVVEFEKTLVTVGNRKGVPSLVVQHGISGHPIGFLPLAASKIAAWGRITRDWLVKEGVDGDRVVITGSPRYDRYLLSDENRVKEKEKICRELHLDLQKKIIVFATDIAGEKTSFANLHVSLKEMETYFHVLIKALRAFPEAQLVIKFHPGIRNEDVQRELIQRIGGDNVVAIKNIDMKALLNSSDILIALWSTVGLEAMILDKPVITMDLTDRVVPHHAYKRLYAKSGAAIGVYNEEDLVPAIRDALYNEEVRKRLAEARNKFVYEYVYKQDGKPSKRVADLIIQMMKEPRRKNERIENF
jgi:CDP-glycerol glycerophosphotransferase (TagB/SpsB family)